MKFGLRDKLFQYIDGFGRRQRRRWIEIWGRFESPYCRVSQKRKKNSWDADQLSDFQFQNMKKPQPEILLVIQLGFSHAKKISEKEILRRIGSGEGTVIFGGYPDHPAASILKKGTIEITSDDIKRKDLFLRRLLKEKELGYY